MAMINRSIVSMNLYFTLILVAAHYRHMSIISSLTLAWHILARHVLAWHFLVWNFLAWHVLAWNSLVWHLSCTKYISVFLLHIVVSQLFLGSS